MRFQVSDPAQSGALFSQSTVNQKADFGRVAKSGEPSRTNPGLKRPAGVWVALVGAMFVWAAVAGAQVAPVTPAHKFVTAVNVGAPAVTEAVQVTISAAGSLSLKEIKVLTQGVPNRDFTFVAGGSCAVGNAYFAGQPCTVTVNFQAKYPGFRQGAVVLLASNGTVLGTRLLSGTGVGPTAVFVPGMISSVAGIWQQFKFHGDGGPATKSELYLPQGGAADAAGDLFLSDSLNNRIRFVNAATGLISTVAGNGTAGFSGEGGVAKSAMLDLPADVRLDGAGNLYIADSQNHAIRMVNAATGIIWTLAGIGGQSGYSGDGGLATNALLNSPSGIALDGDHTLYISDTDNNAIRKVDLATGIITTVAGIGTLPGGYSGDGGQAILGKLNGPLGIALGTDGSLYIADQSNNRIRKVDAAGVISTVVGTGARGFGGDSGPATKAQLSVPAGVLIDVAGNLYVADSGNQLVRKVDQAGVIETIAGIPGGGAAADGVAANTSGFNGPYALFLDGPGNLYIADTFNQLIRMVSSNVAALSYPPMRVGRTSPPQPVTIENDGNASLNFSEFNKVSNSDLDSVTTTCVTMKPVEADSTCVLGVEFAPTVTGTPVGTPVTGSLSVTTDAANNPSVVDLSGLVLLVNPTTAALTPSLNPAPLNTLVTFTAVVSNSLPTAPGGTVNFFDGAVQIGTASLATGAAAISINTLTAGSHTITAVYSGDPQNAAITSNQVIEVVQQPTSTKLTSSAPSSVAGASVTFTATVAGPDGSTVPPSGTVLFFDGAAQIGRGTLTNGVATLAISTLSVGQRSITANYQGDASDFPSVSAPLIETVNPAVTTTLLTTSNASVFAGVSVTFTAVVSRIDGMIPTGIVTFNDGATQIGTGTLDAKGATILTTTALAGGVHTITATYKSDANNSASSGTVTETVQPIATATTVAASVNPGIAGAPLTLTATPIQTGATGTGGAFTGTVTFFDGATQLGAPTALKAGTAVLSVSTLAVGPHTITARYDGSANYLVSTSTPLAEPINPATTTTVLKSSLTPSIAGNLVTLTATVTGNGGTPTGAVTVTDSAGATLGPVTLANGIATFITSALAVGSHTLTAAYAGGPNDTPSTSAPVSQLVLIATSNTALKSSPNPSAVGASVTFTANVTTNGGAATGTVTFSDGATVLGLGPVPVTAGTAVFSTTALLFGPHTITAAYAGDANDTASQSTPLIQQVQQAGPVTLISSANPSIAGTSVTFTATVAAPQGAAVTGTVTFKEGAIVLGTGTVNSSGVAVFITSALAVGLHSIVASYGGDANNQAASSIPLAQIVETAGTSVTLISSANPSLTSAPLTLTATVVGTGGIVTGTVTFKDGAATLGASGLSAAGVATLVVNGLAPGLHSIVAVYGGDANNGQNFSPTLAQNVLQATTVSLSSSEIPSLALDAVTFTAAVGNGGGKTPTGTVVFSDGTGAGAKVLGTVPLGAAGTATFTASLLTVGTHAITVTYSGDSLNQASVSAVLSQPVQLRPTSDTLSASSTSLTGGQQVTLISVVRYAGPVTPTGTVSFLSNGLPLGTSVVDNAGVATLTVILLTVTPTVTAGYSGDSVYAASTSPQTSITVAKPTQFTMQLSPAAVTMQSQQNSTTTLTITSLNGFSDKLDLGCLGLPFAATCTFAQDQVALVANGVQSIRVVIDTGSPLTAGPQARLEQHGAGSLAALCILPGGTLLGLAFWRGRRKLRTSLAGLTVLLLLAGLSAGLSGCGGLHISGTPPGTYLIQVSATGAGTGVTQAIDVTMTVTQ